MNPTRRSHPGVHSGRPEERKGFHSRRAHRPGRRGPRGRPRKSSGRRVANAKTSMAATAARRPAAHGRKDRIRPNLAKENKKTAKTLAGQDGHPQTLRAATQAFRPRGPARCQPAQPEAGQLESVGNPCVTASKTTGRAVASTAEIGATMPMRPAAKPRKRNTIPVIAERPANAPHANYGKFVTLSPRTNATITTKPNPTL